MKRKAIALLATAIVFSSTPTYAATFDDYFNSDNNLTKVNVLANNQYIYDPNVPNFVLNARTVVPLKALAESVGFFIQDDGNGTVQIIKPNVNMVVSESAKVNSSNNKFSIVPFSAVSTGQKIAPHIYFVVDHAPIISALSYKIVVLDPLNNEVSSSSPSAINTQLKGAGFVGIISLDNISFDKQGDYKVQFLMKGRTDSDYLKVGETIIKSIK